MRIASANFKKIFVVAMIFVLAMTLVACNYKPATDPTTGTNGSNQGGNDQNDNNGQGGSQGGDVVVDSDVFTVRLSEEIPYAYIADIQVIWTDTESVNDAYVSAYFDKNGVATTTGLDGEYKVTLSALPEGYTYNPNIYYANSIARDVEIKMFKLLSPDNADTATGLDKYDSFALSTTGAYRAVLTADNFENGLWFTYKPTVLGTYSVESIIDTTQNKLNPILDVHNGTFAFVNPIPESTIDEGGASGTYTKNFHWQIELKSIGNVYHFRIYAETLDKGVFPIYVDFVLDRDGELTNTTNTVITVEVTHDFEAMKDIAFSDMSGTPTWYARYDGNNGVLDGSKVFYAGDEYTTAEEIAAHNYYYVLDSKGNKKILYVVISDANEVIPNGFTYDLNLPRKITGKDEHGEKQIYNYVDFIKEYEAQSSDGCYPVTAEMQLFLQRFSISRVLFNDGNGMAESNDGGTMYSSSDENQWLFACRVYA